MQGVWGYRNAFMFNERVFIPGIWRLDEEGRVKEEWQEICFFLNRVLFLHQRIAILLNTV